MPSGDCPVLIALQRMHQRPFQAARQAIHLVDVQDLEFASPGSFAHGVDPRTVLLAIGGLSRVLKDLDDLDPIAIGLFLDLA
mgnify:CR=1 FL=1